MGTTVLQIPAIIVDKNSQLKRDENSNGFLEPGDSILYTVTIQNTGTGPTTVVIPVDDLGSGLTYVVGSITCTGCQIMPVDDSSGTPFPLDGAGFDIGDLGVNDSAVIQYEVDLDLNYAESTVNNTASATTDEGGSDEDTEKTKVYQPLFELDKESSEGGNSTTGVDGNTDAGDTITYTLRPRSPGSELITDAVVTDAIPANTTYVGDSDDPEVDDDPTDSDPLTWSLGSNDPGQPGSDTGGALLPDADYPVSRR